MSATEVTVTARSKVSTSRAPTADPSQRQAVSGRPSIVCSGSYVIVAPAESAPSAAWQVAVTDAGCSGSPAEPAAEPPSAPLDGEAAEDDPASEIAGSRVKNHASPTPTSTRHRTAADTVIHRAAPPLTPGTGDSGPDSQWTSIAP